MSPIGSALANALANALASALASATSRKKGRNQRPLVSGFVACDISPLPFRPTSPGICWRKAPLLSGRPFAKGLLAGELTGDWLCFPPRPASGQPRDACPRNCLAFLVLSFQSRVDQSDSSANSFAPFSMSEARAKTSIR